MNLYHLDVIVGNIIRQYTIRADYYDTFRSNYMFFKLTMHDEEICTSDKVASFPIDKTIIVSQTSIKHESISDKT